MFSLLWKYLYSLVLAVIVFAILLPGQVLAATAFDLSLPPGPYTRGQDFQVTISLDTRGSSLTSATTGLTYDTQFLQYLSTLPGDTMTSVQASPAGSGRYVLSGTNPAGFSGSGSFALVNFKIIAASPGSTEICALFNPTSVTTAPAVPKALPKTGSMPAGGVYGILFVVSALGLYVLTDYMKYASHRK